MYRMSKSYPSDDERISDDEDDSYQDVKNKNYTVVAIRSSDAIVSSDDDDEPTNTGRGQIRSSNEATYFSGDDDETSNIGQISSSEKTRDKSSQSRPSEESSVNLGNESKKSLDLKSPNSSNHNVNLTPERQNELINAKKYYEAELMKETKMLQNLKATTKVIKMENLPDKGAKLRSSIEKQVKRVQELNEHLNHVRKSIDDKHLPSTSVKSPIIDPKIPSIVDLTKDDTDLTELGKRALATHQHQQSQTVQTLEKLHTFLKTSPEDEEAEDPKYLKVSLLPHQKVALTWLLRRETEFPAGGILADDMGLGKTLTIISLILKDNELGNTNKGNCSSSDDEDFRASKKYPNGNTLVVCPASVLGQWSNEVQSKVKSGRLSVYTHHGTKRDNRPNGLVPHDIVVTTYSVLEHENRGGKPGPLLNIRWKRIVLDEAHIIRNYKSQTAQAVFALRGKKRWALTGTPIHNKQEDFYSLLRFLKCKPFDDLATWKKMVGNKAQSGMQRLHLLTKSLLLRRTKEEIQESGGLKDLQPKQFTTVEVKLDPEEFDVYKRVSFLSSTLLAQYIHERAEKENLLNDGLDIRRKGPTNPFDKHPELGKLYNHMHQLGGVKTHQILVLLLRLRQICCHASLITSLIDQQELHRDGVEDDQGNDVDLVEQMMNLSILPEDSSPSKTKTTITSDDPVFRQDRCSSKMRAIIDCVSEILHTSSDKIIIVSQWTQVLEILETFLRKLGMKCVPLNGKVPVKDRIGIIEDFNKNQHGPKVMLLSLTAGGTGLNLVGANHLLLIDIHWNPQLEAQACDRIYRVGQKKVVHIYKFLCKDTIEERILKLQNNKLELAKGVLTGSAKIQSSKLTLHDLKLLFDIK